MSWQEKRTVAVATPLGKDVLLFRRMVATEQLNRPFTFDLELLSENHGISSERILGQPVTVRLDLPADDVRHFNGLVSQFAYQGTSGRYASYRCRLSPWLWFLTRASNCRIFQNKTVPQILKAVFQDRGFTDVDDGKLTGSYRKWVYCVQYRETDFDFVSRLMEEEGISYFFRHEKGKHTLMLADDNANLDTLPNYQTIPFYPPEDARFRERDHISQWIVGHEVQSGAAVLRNFDFEKPSANLETRLTQPCGHALARFEVYDYPGAYTTKADGDALSRLRLEQSHVGYERAQGSGDVAGLAPGYLFTLTNHPRPDQNRNYVIEATTLEIVSEAYESGNAAADLSCRCTLTAIDRSRPYRPPRITAKPTVHGPQTAIVTGPAGEEIWTDKYGRVKVQFHWDREGQHDENSSCWVRVSHPWAGKGWGTVSIPRIGQEVIVDFLEGDPDQPIITGRVYNAETTPPYGLPAGAVQSGIKSQTHKGQGYNEYVMDDTAGNELIREHAQYDKDSTIEHDLRLTIHNNRTSTVDVDDTETVKGNQSMTVNGNQTMTIDGTRTETVNADESVTINAARTEHVTGTETVTIDGNTSHTMNAARTKHVTGTETVTIDGNTRHTINANFMRHATGNYKLTADGNLKTDAGSKWKGIGGEKATLRAPNIKIEATSKIEIVCGGSSITLEPGKITIESGRGDIYVQDSGVDVMGDKIKLNCS